MLHIQHTHTNRLHTLTQTPGLVAPSTKIPRHRHLTGRAGRTETPCHSPHSQVCAHTPPHVHQNSQQYKSSPNFHVLFTQTRMNDSLSPHICVYIPFLLCRKEEGALVPVPVRDAADAIDAELHLVGPVIRRHVPVLLPEQGAPGAAVGPAKGQPQDYDLPKDGTGAKELLPHRGDPEGEEEAHVPLR